VTTLNSFYASANALSNRDQRRWALGAAYRLGEYTRFGYSIAAARALVLAAPQYANGLTAAGLTAAYNAVDDVGGGAFAPTDLGASLLAWWKADSLVLANAAPVTSWTDSSGNGRTLTQATAANQPAFSTAQVNGLPAVTFDGTTDFLATAAFASPTSGAAVFGLVRLVDADAYRTLFNHAAAATWATPFSRVLLRATDQAAGRVWQYIVEDATVVANTLNGSAAQTATWMIVEASYDQSNLLLLKTGTADGTKARTGALTSSTQPVFLGADTGGSENWNGAIAELVYCSQLDSTQRGQIRSYLQGRAAL
jgi:hypothetical protein